MSALPPKSGHSRVRLECPLVPIADICPLWVNRDSRPKYERRAAIHDPPPLEIRRRGESDQLPKRNLKASGGTALRDMVDYGPIVRRLHSSKLHRLQITHVPEI
jgi:hypothetical protein